MHFERASVIPNISIMIQYSSSKQLSQYSYCNQIRNQIRPKFYLYLTIAFINYLNRYYLQNPSIETAPTMLSQSNVQNKFIDVDDRQNPIMTIKTVRFYLQKDLIPLQPPPKKLHLNLKGFNEIIPQTIYEICPQLQSLWIDHNSIRRIGQLDSCSDQLICLYANNNLIQKMQPLRSLKNLQTLNLCHNKIERIENLKYLVSLNNINVSYNFLTNQHSIMGLTQAAESLSVVQLSNNQLACTEEVFNIFLRLPELNCLYLKATPINRGLKNYRKRLIAKLRKLKFLDDRPVLAEDHRLAEAFLKGGIDMERQQKARLISEKQEKNKKIQHQLQIKHQQQQQKKKEIINAKKKPLQERLQQIQEKQEKNETDIKQIRRLSKKIEDIKNCKPKSFLASISKQKIKIQNVSDEQEQKQIIDEYFKTEKQQIEQKKKGLQIREQKKTEIDRNLQQQHNNQLRRLIDIDRTNEDQIENQIKAKWNKKYQPLLQALLQKYRFDFSEVQPSFNMIMADINKKMVRAHQRFEQKELRLIWTIIEKRKRRQKIASSIQQIENKQQNA